MLLAAIKKEQRLYRLSPQGGLVPVDTLNREAIEIT